MYLNYLFDEEKIEKEMEKDLDFAIQSQDDELLDATRRLCDALRYHREEFGFDRVEWISIGRGVDSFRLYLNFEFEKSCDDFPLHKLAEYVLQTPCLELDHCRDGRFLSFCL